MLESTRVLFKMNTMPEQHTTFPVPKKDRNSRKHNTNTTLKIGDKVLKENSKNKHRMGGKLDKCWTGPFIYISEDLGKRRF